MKSVLALLLAMLIGATPAAADSVLSIPLPAKDLLYDPFRRVVYASIPGRAGAIGNSVIALDPERETLSAPVFVGSEPGKLALSDDGRYLYVALDGAAAVSRVDLGAGKIDLQFPVGHDQYGLNGQTLFVGDMQVLPGSPRSVAISRNNNTLGTYFGGVAIYDDGVPRPHVAQAGDSRLIQFSASAARLYGFDNGSTAFSINRMAVDSAGVSVIDSTWNLTQGFQQEMKFDNGLLYMSSGTVIDPEAKKAVGTCPGIRLPALVQPDSTVGRVFFLTGDGPSRSLLAFDSGTLQPTGSLAVPSSPGPASSLIRWGQERSDARGEGGLAFRTDDQIVLIRTSLIPPPALSFTLGATSVIGGTALTGTVTLSRAAAPGGTPVQLASADPSVQLPPSVTVPAGSASSSFPVTTAPVAEDRAVVVTAHAAGVTASVRLLVLAPTLASLTLRPSALPPGGSATGTVALTGPAPAGGIAIHLSSNTPSVVPVPETVQIVAGQSTATFPVAAVPVTTSLPVTITATGPGGSAKAGLRISAPSLQSLTLDSPQVVPGATVTGSVTLSGPAPPRGASVALYFDGIPMLVQHVVVPAGAVSAPFAVPITPDVPEAAVMVTASYGGVNRTASLEIRAPRLVGLALRTTTVRGGAAVTGRVTLDSPAPPSGWEIDLKCDTPDLARVPDRLSVPAGATAGDFPVATNPVSTTTPVRITATRFGRSFTAALALLPPAAAALALEPDRVTGGGTATGTVTLTGPAAEGGALVALASTDPSLARVPDSVRVPAGESTATFSVTTMPVRAPVPVGIAAAAGGAQATATLQVVPPIATSARRSLRPRIAAVTLQTARVAGGRSVIGQVRLLTRAPAGGESVALTSDRPEIAAVPAHVTIAAGARMAIFRVTTVSATASSVTRILATAEGDTVSALLTVVRR